MTNEDVLALMPLFAFKHLPENLQKVSEPFGLLAIKVMNSMDDFNRLSVIETYECLRKLIEAKDCAVRAALAGVKKDKV